MRSPRAVSVAASQRQAFLPPAPAAPPIRESPSRAPPFA
jgi:hypothetical protein